MINRLIGIIIVVSFPIAIFLFVNGVRHVDIGPSVMAFIRGVNLRASQIDFAIPQVSKLTSYPQLQSWQVVSMLIQFFNMTIDLVNFAINILNVIVSAIILLKIIW